jgi:hypothetical protein
MPFVLDDRLLALFASFNTLDPYIAFTREKQEIYNRIIDAMTSVHEQTSTRRKTLHDVHRYFQDGYEALSVVLTLAPENDFLQRAMLSCEIAALATVDDSQFDLHAVLAKRTQLREAYL